MSKCLQTLDDTMEAMRVQAHRKEHWLMTPLQNKPETEEEESVGIITLDRAEKKAFEEIAQRLKRNTRTLYNMERDKIDVKAVMDRIRIKHDKTIYQYNRTEQGVREDLEMWNTKMDQWEEKSVETNTKLNAVKEAEQYWRLRLEELEGGQMINRIYTKEDKKMMTGQVYKPLHREKHTNMPHSKLHDLSASDDFEEETLSELGGANISRSSSSLSEDKFANMEESPRSSADAHVQTKDSPRTKGEVPSPRETPSARKKNGIVGKPKRVESPRISADVHALTGDSPRITIEAPSPRESPSARNKNVTLGKPNRVESPWMSADVEALTGDSPRTKEEMPTTTKTPRGGKKKKATPRKSTAKAKIGKK